MNKTAKIIHWVSTGLLSTLMLLSTTVYIFNHEEAAETFRALGHPTHIIYPLAIAKILGVITLWIKGFPLLKEWAYAGFTFNILIALLAHMAAGDGRAMIAVVAVILVTASYLTYRKRLAVARVEL